MSHPEIDIEHESFTKLRQTYSDLSCTCCCSSVSKKTENRVLNAVRVVEVETGANSGQKLFMRMLYKLKTLVMTVADEPLENQLPCGTSRR